MAFRSSPRARAFIEHLIGGFSSHTMIRKWLRSLEAHLVVSQEKKN